MKIEVSNIVAQADLKFKINLSKLAIDLKNSEYEPEAFPGLTLRLKDPKASFLIFSSGKIVITGCKSLKNLKAACEKVEVMIQKYKMV